MKELDSFPFEDLNLQRPFTSDELKTRWLDEDNLGGTIKEKYLRYPPLNEVINFKVSKHFKENVNSDIIGLFDFTQL